MIGWRGADNSADSFLRDARPWRRATQLVFSLTGIVLALDLELSHFGLQRRPLEQASPPHLRSRHPASTFAQHANNVFAFRSLQGGIRYAGLRWFRLHLRERAVQNRALR